MHTVYWYNFWKMTFFLDSWNEWTIIAAALCYLYHQLWFRVPIIILTNSLVPSKVNNKVWFPAHSYFVIKDQAYLLISVGRAKNADLLLEKTSSEERFVEFVRRPGFPSKFYHSIPRLVCYTEQLIEKWEK